MRLWIYDRTLLQVKRILNINKLGSQGIILQKMLIALALADLELINIITALKVKDFTNNILPAKYTNYMITK